MGKPHPSCIYVEQAITAVRQAKAKAEEAAQTATQAAETASEAEDTLLNVANLLDCEIPPQEY